LVNDRQCRLVLKVSGAAIPKLCLVVERVQDGRGVPLAKATVDADRDRAPISESPGRVMAGGTCHRAVCGQPTVEEQFQAEIDLGGGKGIVCRNDRLSELLREANLVSGPRLRQDSRLGNRRRLTEERAGWLAR